MTSPSESPDLQLRTLAEQCLCPEQLVDLGSEAPDAQPHRLFLATLDTQLGQLFDHLADLLAINNPAALPLATRALLTLVYCEQTAKYADFKTAQPELRRQLEALPQWLLADWLNEKNGEDGGQQLIAAVLAWYKERVTAARWRRQLGATLGLARFVVLCYPPASPRQLSRTDALFLLAAGTLTAEHFEPSHTELALDIFTVILRHLPAADMLATNLAEPIYQFAIRRVPSLKGLPANQLLWHCLCQYLHYKSSPDQPAPAAGSWTVRDDVCRALLTRLAFENVANLRLFFVQCISRVLVPSIEWPACDDNRAWSAASYEDLRTVSREAGCCAPALRWIRKLGQIFVYQVSCTYGSGDEVLHMLRAIHCAYLGTLYAMPPQLWPPAAWRQLLDSWPKDLLTLVANSGACGKSRESGELRREVREILRTLERQLADCGRMEEVGKGDVGREWCAGRRETLEVLVAKLGDM